jgi:hypothetical protein
MREREREREREYHLFHEAESSGLSSDADIAERGFRSGHGLCDVVFVLRPTIQRAASLFFSLCVVAVEE